MASKKSDNEYFEEIDEIFDAFKYDPASRTVKFPKDYTLLKLVKSIKDVVKRAQEDTRFKPKPEKFTKPTITQPIKDKKTGKPGGFVMTPELSMRDENIF